MDKVDFKKELKQFYNPSTKEVSVVDVPALNFLLVDGKGAPASPHYVEAVSTLFSVAYAIKFIIKKGKDVDYGVMPLEGLWWMDDTSKFTADKKDEWKWTAMIMQPKYVTAEDFKAAVEQTKKKKDLLSLPKIRFESSRKDQPPKSYTSGHSLTKDQPSRKSMPISKSADTSSAASTMKST